MAYEAWSVEWDMPVIVQDPFRRTVYGSWGNAPGNRTYVSSGGAATDVDNVDGAAGLISNGSVNALRYQLIELGSSDGELICDSVMNVTPSGAAISRWYVMRAADTSNYYVAVLSVSTAAAVSLILQRRVGGALSGALGTGITAVGQHTAGSTWRVRFGLSGSTLMAMAWDLSGEQPATWQVTATDTTLLSGTLGGVACRLESGNSNSLPVVISWDNLKVTAAERWVDVTAYVDTVRGGAESGGSPFTISGGDTPEASADTGGVGLPLLNADQRFTPGNTLSPYAPNIAPGSRIRFRETILDQRFDRFTGYVQYPEIQAWTESSSTSPRDQQITIPVVDRAAWIAQGRTFVGTLAEHIIYNGGPSLIGYWPLNEAEGPDVNPFTGGPWTLTTVRKRLPGWIAAVTDQQPSISFGNSGVAPADDITSVSFSPTTITDPITDYFNSFALEGKRSSTVTLGADQVVTVVGWTRPAQLLAGAVNGTFAVIEFNYIFGSTVNYVSVWINTAGNLVGGCNSPNWGGSVVGPPAPSNHSMPIAVRVGYDPAVLELWVRDEIYIGTNVITSAQPALLDTALIADRYPGAVNHMQIYLGDPDDWTHDDFIAQYQMGLTGMERQSTGERVRTVLQYAGVDPSELGRIDDGASLMQVARMAGRDPMDLVAEAVETEQGEFYMAGDNRPVFDDRIRLYNV